MIWSLFWALIYIIGGAILVIGGAALAITVITGPSKVAEYRGPQPLDWPEPLDYPDTPLGFTQWHGSHGGPRR